MLPTRGRQGVGRDVHGARGVARYGGSWLPYAGKSAARVGRRSGADLRVGAPPQDVTPAALFRCLLCTPRADAPIHFDLADLHGAFSVVAPTTLEESSAFDRVDAIEAEGMRGQMKLAALTHLCLQRDGQRIFDSMEQVADLDCDTFDAVTVSVFLQLSRIAPSYLRSDIAAWRRVLRLGAEDPANLPLGERLACCVDGELGRAAIPRPDRFFGVHIGELTDGQWLVFRAARYHHVERHLKQQQRPRPKLSRPR